MTEKPASKNINDLSLTRAQRKKLMRIAGKVEGRKSSTRRSIRKGAVIAVLLLFAVVAMVGFVKWSDTRKSFPPTSFANHTEVTPEKHISAEAFSFAVQVHMLEHADGVEGGTPGIFINYNCNDFDCESDLIDNLTKIAQDYPESVYLAPYPNMGAKLVLTKEGEQEIIENFNEDRIRSFLR